LFYEAEGGMEEGGLREEGRRGIRQWSNEGPDEGERRESESGEGMRNFQNFQNF
jgi:hypothetical protein